MQCSNKKPDVFTDINGLVELILEDIAERPIPRGAEPILSEIRAAAADGNATAEMATTLIELFPNDKPSR